MRVNIKDSRGQGFEWNTEPGKAGWSEVETPIYRGTKLNKKLLVIQVAALSHHLELEGLASGFMQSVFPALTCTVQASFRTAAPPSKHGMVANGLYYRALNRPMFWEQSAGLVHGPRIWNDFRSRGKTVGVLFWQQSLGENADIILSPAPIHKHGGGMIQGCYAKPPGLYEKLSKRIGKPFKLQQYWGPLASWKVGDWIVAATRAILEDPELAPDLCLTYLPTMDYDLQRKNPAGNRACRRSREKADHQLAGLVRSAMEREYEVVIYGDYHIAPVNGAVLPNLALRSAGLMKVRSVKGMAYPDFYAGKAFAVVDHEIAHVYISNMDDAPRVKETLSGLSGVDKVLDRAAMAEMHVNHENSGELLMVAEPGKWFAYPWWAEKHGAPDFAGHVDIHNKPGYDPCELFFGWPPGTVSQNTGRIRGSHGRTGTGREVMWAASFSIPDKPENLIELATIVRDRLDQEAYQGA